jgi:hypothetical protein
MRLRIYLLCLTLLAAMAGAAHPAQASTPLGKAEGLNALKRYANLEKRELERKGYTVSYGLGTCRRERNELELLVVWCPISWTYDPPLEGEWVEDRTRLFAFVAPRGCIFVKEGLFAGHRCFDR